jgi:hypothetical protein
MAKQYTGIDGALYIDGAKVGRVTNWELDGAADTLETTTLGDAARTYVYGVQGYSGSLSLLYYETDANTIDGAVAMGDVLRTTATPTATAHTLDLRLNNGSRTRSLTFQALLNNVSISAQVGEIITAEVQFTVTGALTTATVV